MDPGRLSKPDWLTLGAAFVLLIATFMAWFKIEVFGASTDATGWELGWLWGRLPLLIGMVLAAHVLVTAFAPQVKLPAWPWVRVHLIGGAIAAAIVLLRLLFGYEVRGFDYHRAVGLFVALVATLGLTGAGLVRHREGAGDQPL